MKTTTYMNAVLKKKERDQLIDAYIPTDYEHYFDNDADLNEVFQAYIGFNDDALADQYLEYIVKCFRGANEHSGIVDILTANSWIKAQKKKMGDILNNWNVARIENVDFGAVAIPSDRVSPSNPSAAPGPCTGKGGDMEKTDRYRIDYVYGNVYEYDADSHAYVFCAKTHAYSKKELKRMELEMVED